MTKDEHKQILDSLLNADSQADRSGLLSQLESDYASMLADNEHLTTERDSLKEENEKFAKVNNELFLQVGASNRNASNNDNGFDDGGEDEPPKKLSYDELKFD